MRLREERQDDVTERLVARIDDLIDRELLRVDGVGEKPVERRRSQVRPSSRRAARTSPARRRCSAGTRRAGDSLDGAPSSCSSVVTIVAKFGQWVSGSSEKKAASRASTASVSGQDSTDALLIPPPDRGRSAGRRSSCPREYVSAVKPPCARIGQGPGPPRDTRRKKKKKKRRRPMANLVVHFEDPRVRAAEADPLLRAPRLDIHPAGRKETVLDDRDRRGSKWVTWQARPAMASTAASSRARAQKSDQRAGSVELQHRRRRRARRGSAMRPRRRARRQREGLLAARDDPGGGSRRLPGLVPRTTTSGVSSSAMPCPMATTGMSGGPGGPARARRSSTGCSTRTPRSAGRSCATWRRAGGRRRRRAREVATEGWGARLLALQAPTGCGAATRARRTGRTRSTSWGCCGGWAGSRERARRGGRPGSSASTSPGATAPWRPAVDGKGFFEGEVEPCINGNVVATVVLRCGHDAAGRAAPR